MHTQPYLCGKVIEVDIITSILNYDIFHEHHQGTMYANLSV